MICRELREFYELYAMDALEKDTHSVLHEHLDRNCPVCTRGV
ncbi:MAG TPA: hypothetical protein VLT57_18220 [Bryobacteraceae bacterium]|nr:hypothetical protein [Bryobacteraceae bacterium]